jgi:ParB-like chromosome segregation protein Spo0J
MATEMFVLPGFEVDQPESPQVDHAAIQHLVQRAEGVFAALDLFGEATKVEALNQLRMLLHQRSPFAAEPVDCVQWIRAELVQANDYNPNTVAPPEMALLEHSVTEDGYTQPIVAWPQDEGYEVVDGFHRNRVGRESATVRERVKGYLPLTIINPGREDRGDRIAATIRHNRARGKHRIDAMAEIVLELKRRNWTDAKIGRELGMDPDEVLRLSQITGLAEMFANREFSEAWEADIAGPNAETLEVLEEGPGE